jgi:hypothetical protein
VAQKASEQVENKFIYATEDEGHSNKGVYILQYGEDFSVTPAQ